ncbi:sensor histidine kinase [Arcticibacterium luteifluviistationis]|uniref:histidine kinase n=1 Tax=Arcticibacterium luteifluviistationis TaxID=1784714 RepID=A0A2Z4GH12_9BACT|nr:histidine kinase [Arcticibacterium luteifluviistationis]AWW00094.1 histidine kinase [Arcticibacterium luteifluviistationis]
MDPVVQSILIGTVILTLMGFSVVGFVIYYQRKQFKSQRDLIQLKEAHQKQMLSNSLAVQEVVRRKISNDLHDEIGGLLSATKLSISSLSKQVDASVLERVNHSKQLVTEALSQVRSLSRDLIPRTLEKFGLELAIQEFIQKMEEAASLEFHFSHEDDLKRFHPDLELAAYRIIQELTNNSLKHAEASLIEIDLRVISEKLQIKFTDNGKGFDLASVLSSEKEGLGLGNIFSRLSVIDGEYTFNSNKNSGVEYLISIPQKA